MNKILVVESIKDNLKEIVSVFSEKENYVVEKSTSGEDAIEKIKKTAYQLVVAEETLVDSTGIELAEKTIKINASINFTISSSLSEKDFHEKTEGMGILKKLPMKVSRKEAEDLYEYLNKILGKF